MCNNYCSRCRRKVPVFFRTRRVPIESDYIKTTFVEEYAVCQYCGKEVYDSRVYDRNVKVHVEALEKAIKRRKNNDASNYMEFLKKNEDVVDRIGAIGCPYPVSMKELEHILKGEE